MLRTVSVMATASGLHEEDFDSEAVKVFVSGLRIVGAVLTAAFTAIVTNYLIRARLAGALEAGRIPEGGHVVVCGLTPVGFRVVEELIGLGEPVVVVEVDPANRFVATVRRLKAAVIIGDATIPEVQRQARAVDARAVVAATNDDMVNLEVGLLVREMKPTQRVVLLQGDPNLAQMLRQATNIRFAVSVPALAAPAFLAGLFGDRVLSVFLVNERLLAAINLVIQERDPFVGQSVRAVAVDYRMTPVALLPAGLATPSRQPLGLGWVRGIDWSRSCASRTWNASAPPPFTGGLCGGRHGLPASGPRLADGPDTNRARQLPGGCEVGAGPVAVAAQHAPDCAARPRICWRD